MELSFRQLSMIGVVVGGGLAVGATVLSFDSGPTVGQVRIVAPSDSAMTVFVDGVQEGVYARGEQHGSGLAPGPHVIRVVRPGASDETLNVEIDADGQYAMFVPLSGQCFVAIDVSDIEYGGIEPPRELSRHFDGRPFPIPAGDNIIVSRRDRLPATLQSGTQAILLAQVACSMANASARDLMATQGYR